MEFYLFGGTEFDNIYNCSQLTMSEWEAQGRKRPLMAILLMTIGAIFFMIYLPVVYIMTTSKFICMSCYKIMFCLGLIDSVTIVFGVFVCGYLDIVGAVYCTRPLVVYATGSLGVAAWCGSCLMCVILSFNRCLDIYCQAWHQALFAGGRTWLWMLAAALYMGWVAWRETPVFYNSRLGAGFYDPFLRMPVPHARPFVNWTHVVNNVAVIALLAVLYLWLCVYICSARSNATKRRMVVQTVLVCAPFFLASAIYDYMQFFPSPDWVPMLGHTLYMITGGSAGLVYLIFNTSIRHEFFRLIIFKLHIPLPDPFRKYGTKSAVQNVSFKVSSKSDMPKTNLDTTQDKQSYDSYVLK